MEMLGSYESTVSCGCCDKMANQCRLSPPSSGLACSSLRSVTCRTRLDYSEHRSRLRQTGEGKLPIRWLSFHSLSSSKSSSVTSRCPPIQRLSYLWYFFTLLLLAQSIGFAESASWVKRPQSVERVLGQEVILECEVSTTPQDQLSINWQITTSSQPLFLNTIRGTSTPARMSLVSGTSNLNISGVTVADSVTFQCTPFGSSLSPASATVTVLVQPGAPVITLASSELTEGNNVVLTCKSSGGSPNPNMTWKRNGVSLSASSYTVTGATTPGGETRSDLTRSLTYTDHNAVYTCEVKNTVNEDNPLRVNRTLNVTYAPRISFVHDDREKGKYITVEEQSTMLTCETDANPRTNSYRWLKDGVPQTERISQLNFGNVAKTDQGEYTCFASNLVGTETNGSIFLEVHYTPVISNVPAQKVVNETDFVNVTAVIDANPEPFTKSWEKSGKINSYTPSLIISSVGREHAGNYTFKAINRLRGTGQSLVSSTAQTTMQLIVQYPPGMPSISPLSSHSVGDRVEITCNLPVPGVPASTYEWEKLGEASIVNQQVFTISAAELSNNGQYRCRGRNMLNPGPWQTITLTINEDASFTTNLPSAKNVNISQENFALSCQARGRPEPYIQWKKNGSPFPHLGDGDFYTIREVKRNTDDGYSFLLTSYLEFKGFQRKNGLTGKEDQLVMDDSANYTCEIELNQSQTVHLLVHYAPVVTVSPTKVAQVLNTTVEFQCSARANPEPLFRWLFGETELNSVDKYRIQSGIPGALQGEYLSRLTVNSLADEDLGEYRCRAFNDLGSNRLDVGVASVVRKTTPDAPMGLTIEQVTWNSVLLHWVPGFNGGEDQNFVVRYSSMKGSDNEPGPSSQYMRNLSGLHPSTLYKFNVIGNNSFGLGAESETVNVTTSYYNFTTPTAVKFNRFTNMLLFHAPSGTMYTARIEVKLTNSDEWIVSEENASTEGGSIKIKESSVEDVRISFCLESQTHICSESITAEHSGEEPEKNDMPIEWVIAIACVCGIVIVLLIIALVYVIRRRRQKADKDYELETHANRRSQPINGTRPANGDVRNSSPKRGYDNPDYSSPPMNGGPGYKAHTQHHSPRPNGNVPHNDSFGSQDSMQKYTDENDISGRHLQNYGDQPLEFIPYSSHHFNNNQDMPPPYNRVTRPTKEPYMDYQQKESSMSGQESGYSTPEPAKPKKLPKFLRRKRGLVYYADSSPFAHNPPGHTCGLPCCQEGSDLQILIAPSHTGYCAGIPQNFSLGRSSRSLLQGRPTFKNGNFSLRPFTASERAQLPQFRKEHSSEIFTVKDFSQNNQANLSADGGIEDPRNNRQIIRLSEFAVGESADDFEDSDGPLPYYTTLPFHQEERKRANTRATTKKMSPITPTSSSLTTPDTGDESGVYESAGSSGSFQHVYAALPSGRTKTDAAKLIPGDKKTRAFLLDLQNVNMPSTPLKDGHKKRVPPSYTEAMAARLNNQLKILSTTSDGEAEVPGGPAMVGCIDDTSGGPDDSENRYSAFPKLSNRRPGPRPNMLFSFPDLELDVESLEYDSDSLSESHFDMSGMETNLPRSDVDSCIEPNNDSFSAGERAECESDEDEIGEPADQSFERPRDLHDNPITLIL